MMATQDHAVTIAPYFKIHSGKMAECRTLCERFVETSKSEQGCLYYGWSFNEDAMFCREAYVDADAALAHLQNVGSLLNELIAIADLTRLEIHGLEQELMKLRQPLAEFRPQYFVLEYGFRR
jgi:quinol monooxygenase YgiN